MADESPSSAKVRELIFAYERHSNSTKQLEEYNGRPRAKSIGNSLSYKLFREPNTEFHSITEIEKELVKIEAHLNYYEVYEKETHVAFQEQLFNVLTSIVNIDPEDHEAAVQLKRKLIVQTQKLATDLNSRLPFYGNHSHKGVRRTYSTYVRKEEAVVSTTSVKSQEHRAVLSSQSSHNATLNGGFKSEESLNSTRDSVDLSSRHDESSIDLNYVEERPQSSTPPPQKKIVDDSHSSLIPSVSRLKQFFSFRREAKPEIKVSSASYSGLTRSQSLNVKSNKYTVTKRSKKEESKKKEEAIKENDEVIEHNQTVNTSSQESQESETSRTTISTSQTINTSSKSDSTQSNVYIEPVKEIEEYVEERNEGTHNVSVSKLKSLFEINQNETNEGLGLLTQKQNEFSSDFNLPFTAMNLGAYRLKRTISGNYMNFTGLIRNVELNKSGGDLSKSKSLSDLKITNYGYEAKDVEDDYDLSKEIDDNDDFEHVSINVGKEAEEVNNNVVKIGSITENDDKNNEPVLKIPIQLKVGSVNIEGQSKEVSTSEISQTVQRENESIFLSKSVESLKQTFENLSTSSVQKSKESSNQELQHVIYKTKIEPVSSNTTVVVEPVLKVPIQLRPGITTVSHSEAVIVNSSSSTATKKNDDDITPIIHRTIEPIFSSIDNSEEPRLKVPIQLRTGVVNVNHSQEVTENTHEIKTLVTEDKEISVQQQKEPILKVPIQLRVGVGKTEDVSEVTEKFIRNEKTVQETRETLASPGIVETLMQTYENTSSSSNDLTNQEIKPILHRTIEPISSTGDGSDEPILKVPVQLKIGNVNVSHSHEITENLSTSSAQKSKESSNQEIQHVIHKTKIEPVSSNTTVVVEPVLKVPIQLRPGFTTVSHSEAAIVNSSSSTATKENDGNITPIIHRTIEPILSSIDNSKEPRLKVPIQLRTGVVNVNHSQEVTENTYEIKTLVTQDKEINVQEQKEPILKVPIQLRVGVGKTEDVSEVTQKFIRDEKTIQEARETLTTPGIVETLTQTYENISSTSNDLTNQEIKPILHRTIEPISSTGNGSDEPTLKVPVQLRIGNASVSHSHEITENFSTRSAEKSKESSSQEIQHVIHKTKIEPVSSNTTVVVEPVLKVPIQLRPGFTTVSHSEAVIVNSSSSSATKENDGDITPIVHRTIKPILSSIDNSEEPRLKVPIQLRTGVVNVNHSQEVAENTFEIKTVVTKDKEISVQQHKEPILKVPIQLRVGVEKTEDVSEVTEKFIRNEKTVQEARETLTSSGIVETLTKTYENISSTSNDLTNEEIKPILHRTIEPISSTGDGSDEPILKVPVQLRIGNANVSHSHEVTGNLEVVGKTSSSNTTVQVTNESLTSPGAVETLKQTFENISSTSTELNNEEIKPVLHRIIEPIPSATEGSDEPILKVPIQLRTFAPVFQTQEVTENISSTSNSTVNTENIDHILHRTIEPISSSGDTTKEPVLKVPIQLRVGVSNISHSQEVTENLEAIEKTSSNEKTVQKTRELLASPGTVETLKQTFENISSTSTREVNNEDIEHILHRTIEPITADGSEEPVLKVPIQLRTGFVNVSHSQEVTENLEAIEKTSSNEVTVQKTNELLTSAGTMETLTQTFENISSTSTSEVNNEDKEHILHRTIEPITADDSEPVLKVPIQLRTGFVNMSHSQEVSDNLEVIEKTSSNEMTVQNNSKLLTSSGTVETLKQTFENISSTSTSEVNNEDIEHILHRTIQPITTNGSEEPVLKVPIQLRTGFVNASHSQEVTENTSEIRTLVIENKDNSIQQQKEPELKIPIQLRVGVGNTEDISGVTEKFIRNEKTVQEARQSLTSPGIVETLKQTYETISSTSNDSSNEEIKPIPGSEKPILKVPIQLKTSFANVSHSNEVTENISSTSTSNANNENIEHILHRTIDSISGDGSEEPVLKVPIQLRTGFVNVSHSHEVTGSLESTENANHTVQSTSEVILTTPGTVDTLKETFENLGTSTSSDGTIHLTQERTILEVPIEFRTSFANEHHSEVTEHSSEYKTEISHEKEVRKENTHEQEPVLKVPIQFRLGNNVSTTETGNNAAEVRITSNIEKHEEVPIVDMRFYRNGQEETELSKDGSMSRARIEERTESFMKILDSPSEFSTLVSSSSFGQSQQQASSTSKVSVSYSGQRSVQRTSSTRVSQRIVSTSSSSLSSQQSSQNYLRALEEPVSYSMLSSLSSLNPDEESSVTFTEVEEQAEGRRRLQVNLNVSQENIIAEILNEADSLENIDEEFERMLEENSK